MNSLEREAEQTGQERIGRLGALADLSAWSFYPGKNLGACGEAGTITTDDEEIARKLIGVGAMNPGEQRSFTLAVEVTPAKNRKPGKAGSTRH